MDETLKIALTALGGIAVFVVGQTLQRLFIEPMQEVHRVRGRIAHALSFYANFMHQRKDPFGQGLTVGRTPEEMKAARDDLRKLASDIYAAAFVLPGYSIFAAWRLVPSAFAIDEGAKGLVGWSNSLGGESLDHQRTIARALRLPVAYLREPTDYSAPF